MKDKRLYLKIACLLELIYIVVMTIYYFTLPKTNNLALTNIPSLVIDFLFMIVLYKESNKDIEVLKNNKTKILAASVWLLFDAIVPGVIGLLFLSGISDKKENKLPVVKKDKLTKTGYFKALIVLVIFLLLMFVLPMFEFMNKIPPYIIYIIIFAIIMIFNYKELYSDFISFKNNFKVYLKFILKRYVIMLGVMIIVTMPIILLNGNKTAPNQVVINDMFNKLPVIALLLSTLYAPFAEECVFRLNLSKLFKNKTLFIIVSGLLFGTLHIIGKVSSINDVLYILQYSTLGICLAKAYADSENIFVPVSIHFIQNFLAALVVILFV